MGGQIVNDGREHRVFGEVCMARIISIRPGGAQRRTHISTNRRRAKDNGRLPTGVLNAPSVFPDSADDLHHACLGR